MSTKLTKVCVIVPTYNEAERITQSITDLALVARAIADEYEIHILNVDDGSPDGTARIARDLQIENFHQLNRSGKSGLGPAYIAGFRWALERSFDLIVEMDADGSHLATELPGLLAASEGHGLVIGTRWIPGGSVVNWPWYRQLISKVGTRYAQNALKLPYRDLTSGYRVFSREALASILLKSIQSKGYGFQIELVMKTVESGFSIAQYPITFVERTVGVSKMTPAIAWEAWWNITEWGFRRRFRA